VLNATASLDNFVDPKWKITANGRVDVREVEALASIPGLSKACDLNVRGENQDSVPG